MKIGQAVIQDRNIIESSEDSFEATYKGKRILISTNHGFGKPIYDHLKRFNIDVIDIKTGMYDVETYEDFHEIRDAIRHALQGAMLI
jgi:hypothetical protein